MEPHVQEYRRLITYRGMVRDLVACPQFPEWCHTLDLTPSSPDVDEREHLESHGRINAVGEIATDIAETAAIAGNVVHNLFMAGNNDGTEDLGLYQAIASAAVHASVAHLVDIGKLKVTP
jgi:hypothetical protein